MERPRINSCYTRRGYTLAAEMVLFVLGEGGLSPRLQQYSIREIKDSISNHSSKMKSEEAEHSSEGGQALQTIIQTSKSIWIVE